MLKGIDISGDFQNVTSFHDVEKFGVKFVCVKATQSLYFKAGRFAEYRDRIAEIEGLVFGAYHFLSWVYDPVQQAENFLYAYSPQSGDMYPMMDCEGFPEPPEGWLHASGNVKETHRQQVTAAMLGYSGAIEREVGVKPLVYCDYAALLEGRFDASSLAGHALWIAEYNNADAPEIPNGWPKATLWQHSSHGQVPGIIATGVDMDYFLGDDLSVIRL